MKKFRVEVTTEANKELLKVYKYGRKSDLIKIKSIVKELEIDPKKGLGMPKTQTLYW